MERPSQSPKDKSEADSINFRLFRKEDLRGLAQKLIEDKSIEVLRQLETYAESEIDRLPHSGMYSVEWDYWNYTNLRAEIREALDALGV